MCGIAGVLHSPARDAALEAVGAGMARPLTHRGPDDAGVWIWSPVGLALAHTRLAVIDPTPSGRQPMTSADGRFTLVYNGEIYNHGPLRTELLRHDLRGDSDTEVLVEAIARWGVADTLSRVDGMFAFAVWDHVGRTLTLARDRLGEKPMYYGWLGDTFVFGSELEAIRAHPDFRGGIDREALTLYCRFGYVPAPYSIHAGISKLPAGALLELPADGAARWTSGHGPVRRYWSLSDVAAAGEAARTPASPAEALDELEQVLWRSVADRMVADVPLGAFLSGGVDSTAVVAAMQDQSARPVRTFTVAVDDAAYDESEHAGRVARHLGTDHTELRVTGQDALDAVSNIPRVYDEPFADSSQVPTMLLSALTRRHVTVALSGDGADELFGGYTRYLLPQRVWDRVRWLPAGVRRGVGAGIRGIPDAWWDRVDRLPAVASRVSRPREKARKVAGVLALDSPERMYHHLMSHWPTPETLVLGGHEPTTAFDEAAYWATPRDRAERLMLLDALTYLPDDILTKVDRASMASSLEVRVPFLGREVVEFAWRLPPEMKIRGGEGKWLLRRLVDRHVPRHLTERPKMGFGVPVGDWLRGALRPWAEDLLAPARLADDSHLAVEPIRRAWDRHLGGEDLAAPLWTVLMFQAWRADH